MKTNLARGGRVCFADKWKGSVQVGVPGNRTSSKERRRNEGRSGVDQRLGRHQSDMCHIYLWEFTDLECAGRCCAGGREPTVLAKSVNNPTPNMVTTPKELLLPSSDAAQHERVLRGRPKTRQSC